MAIYEPSAGIDGITGALSKRKKEKRITVTRIKSVKDPQTLEVVGHGKKEMYMQYRRDYEQHPMTEGEQKQRVKWRDACREVSAIIHNKNHPRYMELYQRWRAQLGSGEPAMQFPNFVRAVLASE